MTSNTIPHQHSSDPSAFPQTLTTSTSHVELTYTALDISRILSHIRSPTAGANVLFLGSTRSTFEDRPVRQLAYQAYAPLALRSFQSIAQAVHEKHGLVKVVIMHRLGVVPVGEDSIAVGVSAGHRLEAWKAGEEALERCKERAEVWKREDFEDESGDGVWRENRQRDGSGRLKKTGDAEEEKAGIEK